VHEKEEKERVEREGERREGESQRNIQAKSCVIIFPIPSCQSEVSHMQDDLQSLNRNVETDMKALRSELTLHQKVELSQLQREVLGLEKLIASRHGEYQHAVEALETKLMRYILGSVATLGALSLGLIRLIK